MKQEGYVKPFYNVTTDWFKGDFPPFYDSSKLPGTQILKDNYEDIKAEICAHYDLHPEEYKTNFTPYDYATEGWQTINLYTYFLKQNEICEKFPVIDRVVNSIPYMCNAQIAVLKPQTRIKAHIGDTSVHIRSHLGIIVPGDLPDIGIQMNREKRCWKEGEVLSICPAKRHYAWNFTDHYRIILSVDTFRPEYWKHRWLIAGRIFSGVFLRKISAKRKWMRNMSRWIVIPLHRMLGLGFTMALLVQRKLHIPIEKLRK